MLLYGAVSGVRIKDFYACKMKTGTFCAILNDNLFGM